MSPSSKYKLYADDLKAYNAGVYDKKRNNLSDTLKNITQWAITWQLPISTETSKWLLISYTGWPKKKQPNSDITITQSKINIFISHFQGLKRTYFDTRTPNLIKKIFLVQNL